MLYRLNGLQLRFAKSITFVIPAPLGPKPSPSFQPMLFIRIDPIPEDKAGWESGLVFDSEYRSMLF